MKGPHTRSYRYQKTDISIYKKYLEGRMKKIHPYMRGAHRVLELGCGEGVLGAQIRKESGSDVYGVDISTSGINLAAKRGLKAVKGDLNRALPYSDNMFDLIVSDQLLEHIYTTDHLLGEIYRVLKPGGFVVTFTPNVSFWLNRILFLFGFYPIFLEAGECSKTYGMQFLKKYMSDKEAMGHIRVFNKSALVDIFTAHHFKIVAVYGMPLSWNLPKLLKLAYDTLDYLFSFFPSIARDIVVIVMK